MTPVTQILVGPHRHGVVQFGLALHAALQHVEPTTALRRMNDCRCADAFRLLAGSPLVHTQFTDRLFGGTPHAAATSFTALAGAAHAAGSAITATLHDIPQPSDGTYFTARASAYRSVVAACDAVAVNSDHERELLREIRIGRDVHVIPLPLSPPSRQPIPGPSHPQCLGVFGYVYPGKGHAEILTASSSLPAHVEVHILGAASAGHDDLIADLRRAAALQHRTLRVTGHVADAELTATLRAVTVPVTAHQHISASGSLNAWLSAGRRPLAPLTRYTAEIEQRNPGCLQLFPPTAPGLRSALRRALQHPDDTWLPAGTQLSPTPAETAAAYTVMFDAVAS